MLLFDPVLTQFQKLTGSELCLPLYLTQVTLIEENLLHIKEQVEKYKLNPQAFQKQER